MQPAVQPREDLRKGRVALRQAHLFRELESTISYSFVVRLVQPMPPRNQCQALQSTSRLRLGSLFLRIDELAHFCPLLVDIGQMLRVQLLVNLEFLLGQILFAHVHIRLC